MDNSIDRLSYLHAPDYQYTAIDSTFNPVKNLNELFQSIDVVEGENLKVYLRVRPSLPDENIESKDFQVDIIDKNSIILTAPASSNTFKNASHDSAKLSQKFSFTHIYGPSTTQRELFEESTLGLVNDFIKGQNLLLFTYGATNSGKTFTVQGTPSDPGVLPRTLDVLFRSIGDKHYPRNDLKPRYFCGVSRLEERDVKKEEEKKQNIFRTSPENLSRFSVSLSNLSKFSSDASLNESQPSTTNTSAVSSVIEVPCQEDLSIDIGDSESTVYAVFISFAEIYNEYIYDLLEKIPLSKKNKRSPLMLGEDRNASIYIKGLQEVRVNNAEEALQLLQIGRQNLHFAATRLNHNSSRSHCIFTIKLVRLADANNPHVARVSMMAICDLAGAERAAKTKSTHDRLKEAGNINSSLLVLSRCLDALRQNQGHKISKKKEAPVPYRDSKLTRIFQSFFLGRGKAAMIVNICRSPLLFDETMQVLKFSAIAKQVAISHSKEPERQVAVVPKRSSQFSKFVRQSLNSSGRLSVPWIKGPCNMSFGASSEKNEDSMVIHEEPQEAIEEEEDHEDERCEAMRKMIQQLRDRLFQEHKDKLELEERLREEICKEYSQQIVEIENSWSQRLKEQKSRMDEFSEFRLNALQNSVKKTNYRKRLRQDYDPDEEYVPSIDLFQEQQKVKEQACQIKELEMENGLLKEELEAIKLSQKKTNDQANRTREENSKLTFQLAQLTRFLESTEKELEDAKKTIKSSTSEDQEIQDLQRRLEESQSQLADRDSEIKEFKEMLVEAAEEFIIKEEEIQNISKALDKKETIITNQLMSLNDLESQLSEAREILSQHAMQLEERDQHISELQEQLSVQNVEDAVSDTKELRSIAESYQTQVLILEQNLTATEKERNKAEKELNEIRIKKRQIEEDYLRDKSKLLLELAGLKRNGNNNVKCGEVESAELQEAFAKISQFERENATLQNEKGLLNNQLTESKDLFEHLKKANVQLESYQRTLLKEKEDLEKDVNELSKKLMAVQDERISEQLDTSSLKSNNVNITNQVNTLKNEIQDKEELIRSLNEELSSQKMVCATALADKEELSILNDELSAKVDSLKETVNSLAFDEFLHEQTESLEKELARIKEELRKEKELNALLKEKEELLAKLEEEREELLIKMEEEKEELLRKVDEEKERSLDELNQEREKNAENISVLKSEIEALNSDLEVAKQTLEEKLFEDKEQLRCELEKKDQELNYEIEKLTASVEKEKELREHAQLQKQEVDELLISVRSELEKVQSESYRLREEVQCSQERQLNQGTEREEVIMQLRKEKEDLSCKLSELEKTVSQMTEDKSNLELKLEKAEKQLEDVKDVEARLRTQLLEIKEAETLLKEQKLSCQQELLSCKEDLLTLRTSLANLQDENSSWKEKAENSIKCQQELKLKVKEKEEVITSLNAKVEGLDRKLNSAEHGLEKRERYLEEELDAARKKCDLMEKEIRAVREARQEEVSQYTAQVEEQEEKIQQKDVEVSMLQQELKRVLQMSMTSSMCNDSQNTSQSSSVKKESEKEDTSVCALREEVRLSEAKNENLAKELQDLKHQLEKMSLASLSKATPSKSPRKKTQQSCQKDTASDSENVVIAPTPTARSRSARKPRTPVVTPIQLDTTSDDFVTDAKSTSKKSSRPQRSSRRHNNIIQGSALEINVFEIDEDHDTDDSPWEPSVCDKKNSRVNGRRGRARKAKTPEVFNPHLNNQENRNILANQSQENIENENFKTPFQKQKRPLFKAGEDEIYMGSPNLVEIQREESPHTVVRRQLRSKRK
ncbi:kinesin-like protein KIF20B isoform X2 [Palaemon carinicauda]|uniref:kinesin-like protein KIF20B isoform X2 n=1 Tax=Palaemon carinicauda TaxID=392227 RepID=UPI0035B67553